MNKSELLTLTACRSIAAVATILNVSLATRVLGSAEYGMLGWVLAFHGLCALLLIGPLGQYFNRHINTWWLDGRFFQKLASFARYVVTISLIASAILLSVSWIQNKDIQVVLLVLLTWMVGATSANATIIFSLNTLGWHKESAVLMALTAISSLLISWLLSLVWPNAQAWLFGQASGLTLSAFIGYKFLVQRRLASTTQSMSGEQHHPLFLNRMLIKDFLLPISASAAFIWILWTGWRIGIESLYGMSTLGLVLAGFMLASYMWVMIESLSQQILHPYLFKAISLGKSEANLAYNDFVNLLGPFYLFCAGLLLLSSEAIATLLLGREFRASVEYIQIGIIVEMCRVISGLFAHAVQVTGRASSISWPYAIAVIVLGSAFLSSWFLDLDIATLFVFLQIASIVAALCMLSLVRRMLCCRLDEIRWLAGLMFVALCLSATNSVRLNLAAWTALGWLVLMLLLAAILTWFEYRNNPALKRLYSIKLSANGS